MNRDKETRHLPENAIYVTATCPNCKKEFTYNRQINRRQKYCSYECRYEYLYKNQGYRDKNLNKYYEAHPNGIDSTYICLRCGKEIKQKRPVKYCPDCLEWLAHNETNNYKRRQYIANFNSRSDCLDRPYIDYENHNKITAYGKTYKSKAELCREYNIPYFKFIRDLKRGISAEDAINKERISNE